LQRSLQYLKAKGLRQAARQQVARLIIVNEKKCLNEDTIERTSERELNRASQLKRYAFSETAIEGIKHLFSFYDLSHSNVALISNCRHVRNT